MREQQILYSVAHLPTHHLGLFSLFTWKMNLLLLGMIAGLVVSFFEIDKSWKLPFFLDDVFTFLPIVCFLGLVFLPIGLMIASSIKEDNSLVPALHSQTLLFERNCFGFV